MGKQAVPNNCLWSGPLLPLAQGLPADTVSGREDTFSCRYFSSSVHQHVIPSTVSGFAVYFVGRVIKHSE